MLPGATSGVATGYGMDPLRCIKTYIYTYKHISIVIVPLQGGGLAACAYVATHPRGHCLLPFAHTMCLGAALQKTRVYWTSGGFSSPYCGGVGLS